MNLSFWIVRSRQTVRLFEPRHEKTCFLHMLWLSHLITLQGLVYIAVLGRFITKCRMVYIAAQFLSVDWFILQLLVNH